MSNRTTFRDPLKERTWWTMVSYAFFRLESALTIAMTLLLVFLIPKPFAWWQWWYWLLLGVVAETGIIWASVTDPETGQRLVADMLREQYNPRTLRHASYRKRVEKALDYHQRMNDLIQQSEAGVLKERLQDTVTSIDAWIANMYYLSKRLDAYQADQVIARDMTVVPAALTELEKRFAAERDPVIKAQLEQTLVSKRAHWTNLQELKARMEKADLQLEKTLADLGNIYSQLRQIEARDLDRGRAQRIAQDISEQVAVLEDIVDTMDQIYADNRPVME